MHLDQFGCKGTEKFARVQKKVYLCGRKGRFYAKMAVDGDKIAFGTEIDCGSSG